MSRSRDHIKAHARVLLPKNSYSAYRIRKTVLETKYSNACFWIKAKQGGLPREGKTRWERENPASFDDRAGPSMRDCLKSIDIAT